MALYSQQGGISIECFAGEMLSVYIIQKLKSWASNFNYTIYYKPMENENLYNLPTDEWVEEQLLKGRTPEEIPEIWCSENDIK